MKKSNNTKSKKSIDKKAQILHKRNNVPLLMVTARSVFLFLKYNKRLKNLYL